MNKRLGKSATLVAALGVTSLLAVVAIAGAEKPVKVVAGNLEAEFNGGISPKVLSKTKPTPITFNVSGKFRTLSGDPHPPAIKEFVIEGDKHASISVKGIPVCQAGKLQSVDTEGARKACGPALIGSGKAKAGIKFPEQPEIFASSELLAFNGGSKGGVTTFYIHAYITVPTPAAIVTVVKTKKIHKGRYGLESISTIPKIAGGSGSVLSFSLTLNKGIISATCPDGHLDARGMAVFADGTKAKGAVVRSCTGKN